VIEAKGLTRRREDAKKGGEVGWSAKTDTLAASRFCGMGGLEAVLDGVMAVVL